MSRSPDDEKFRRILEFAYSEFNTKGFREATIKTIAEKAGVAPGSVYTYFTNKADLFHKTVQFLWESIFRDIDGTTASKEPFDQKFFALYDRVMNKLVESPVFLMGMMSSDSRRKAVNQNLKTLAQKLSRLFSDPGCRFYRTGVLSPEDDYQAMRIILTGSLFDAVLAGPSHIRDNFLRTRHLLVQIQEDRVNE